jgi:hypothetical protein
MLPRVAHSTREQIAREFDDLGPDKCIWQVSAHLREHNPEWLHMATKWASDLGNPQRILGGFCMFYRLLVAQAFPDHKLTMIPGSPTSLNPLPRITTATRAAIVAAIDDKTIETIIYEAISKLGAGNPELLQMADYFASSNDNYLGIMQGFALLYAALLIQSGTDAISVH